MEDEVFTPLLPVVPDLSCPPPGWAGGGKYRGRGQELGGHHPTRVIRRTDLRTKLNGGQRHNNKAPRFSNHPDKDVGPTVDRRSSWGEEWKPEKTEGPVVEALEDRDDPDSGGEWRKVAATGGNWRKVAEHVANCFGHLVLAIKASPTPARPPPVVVAVVVVVDAALDGFFVDFH